MSVTLLRHGRPFQAFSASEVSVVASDEGEGCARSLLSVLGAELPAIV